MTHIITQLFTLSLAAIISTNPTVSQKRVREDITIPEYVAWQEDITPDFNKEIKDCVLDGYIYPSVGTDDKVVNYAKQYINLLPMKVVNRFKDENWKVVFMNEEEFVNDTDHNEILNRMPDHRISGLCCYKDKTIILISKRTFIRTATLHEFGHFVDHEFGIREIGDKDPLFQKEFSTVYIYNGDGNKYNHSTEAEEVASLYSDFILHPLELRKQAPTIFEVMEETK